MIEGLIAMLSGLLLSQISELERKAVELLQDLLS